MPLSRSMQPLARWAAASGLALLLAGCAVPSRVPAGTTLDATQAALGAPTGRYPLPGGGQRLQYSQQPAGSAVWNLDFDAAGRLQHTDQALRYNNFNQIVVDQWTRDDVLRLLGQPARVERVAMFDGPVWTYRFNDLNNFRFIHIHLDPGGVVRRIQYTDESLYRAPQAR